MFFVRLWRGCARGRLTLVLSNHVMDHYIVEDRSLRTGSMSAPGFISRVAKNQDKASVILVPLISNCKPQGDSIQVKHEYLPESTSNLILL
jgi:hypothetical protein